MSLTAGLGTDGRLIRGINPGAGISRFSAAMVVEYGLGAAGYEFRTGTEAQRSRQRTR
jgi:ABC-type proline/glycine betaine transport system substrate-binding protein